MIQKKMMMEKEKGDTRRKGVTSILIVQTTIIPHELLSSW
jgi:hypothetical protein